jgi:CBS-domain-containing membrane protein
MAAAGRRVSEVMQAEVATLAPSDRLDLADDVMQLGRVRHMPVLDHGRVVGIVSSRDLLAASLSKTLSFDPKQRRTFLRSVDVSDVMVRDVISVAPDAALRDVALLMIGHKIGCVPIVKPDRTLLGLVTETDLLRAAFLSTEDVETIRIIEKEKSAMTDLGAKIETELDSLRRTRDELRVQIHLAKAEAKERFEQLEKKFSEAEGKVKFIAHEAQEPLEDVRDAALQLLREIRSGYKHIRDAL